MTLAEARTVLEEYSRWRRLPYDSDTEGPDTDKLDEAIDIVIQVLQHDLPLTLYKEDESGMKHPLANITRHPDCPGDLFGETIIKILSII